MTKGKTYIKNDAFEKIVNGKGGNRAAIGKALGNVSGQLIGQYIAGRQKPKEDFFKKWDAAYKENIRGAFETNVSRGTEYSSLYNITVSSREASAAFLLSQQNIAKMLALLEQEKGIDLDEEGTDGTETKMPNRFKKRKSA